jgi:antibiotic biosynthesis monooxygenase (ABM) superfamily enzyme
MKLSIIRVPFDTIEIIDNSKELFSMLVEYFQIDKLNAEMHKWLKEQNERQAKLETAFSIDDL